MSSTDYAPCPNWNRCHNYSPGGKICNACHYRAHFGPVLSWKKDDSAKKKGYIGGRNPMPRTTPLTMMNNILREYALYQQQILKLRAVSNFPKQQIKEITRQVSAIAEETPYSKAQVLQVAIESAMMGSTYEKVISDLQEIKR